jgi:hemoglobin/transferrin/lactoferrin receptor protein
VGSRGGACAVRSGGNNGAAAYSGRVRRAAPLLLGAALVSAPAAAQDDDGLYWAERLGNRITVTATRTPTEAQDVPATVTVITAEQIADEMATDIKELVRYEPGVSVARAPARFGAALGATGRAGNEGFTIRGIGGNRTQILVDGVRVPDGFSFGAQSVGRGDYVDLGLVKSVEILRGPASALYGSDGLAGAVSFTLSEPSDFLADGQEVAGLVRASYSSDDDEFAETAIVAGRNGALSMLIGYTRRDFHELDNKGTNDTVGALRTTPNPQNGNSDSVLGRLVFEPGGGHKLRLTGEYTDTYLYTDVLSGLGPNGLGATVDVLFGEDTGHRARVAADWTWQGEGAIEYAQIGIYWQDAKDRQFTREDRTPSADRTRINTFENRVYGASAEARSSFATGNVGHRLVFGGDVSVTRQGGLRDGTVPPFGETFPTRAFPVTDFTLGGIFVGDEIALADGLVTLFPALRFDAYKLDASDDPLLPTFAGADQSDERFSPKLGAVVKLSEAVRIYANYATGFKAPSPSQVNNFFENPMSGYISVPNPDLRPETSSSFEGGIRYGGGAFSASLTGFYAEYDDFIDQIETTGQEFPTPGSPWVYQWVNLTGAEIRGIEARADVRLAEGVTLRAAAAYADGDEILEDGSKVPLASVDPFSVVAGLGYSAPGGRFGGELVATHNARKSLASTEGVCASECYRPGSFTILDATVFWRVAEMLTLRAGVFNITDEKYAYWSDVRGLADTSPATDAYTRPGRNASASVSFRF